MMYADDLRLNEDDRDYLWDVIRRLDETFLKASTDEAEKTAPTGSNQGGRTKSRY